MRTVTYTMHRLIYILPLLADAGHAFLSAVLAGLWFGMPFSWPLVLWALAWAYVLDLDNVRHLLRGRIAATKDHPFDHRDGWHYPLPWLVALSAALFAFGANPWTVTAASGIVLHFVNDLFGTGFGLKLYWPFSNTNIKLFVGPGTRKLVGMDNPVVRYTEEDMPRIIREQGDADWIRNHYLRLSPMTAVEYGVFTLGVGALLAWYVLTR